MEQHKPSGRVQKAPENFLDQSGIRTVFAEGKKGRRDFIRSVTAVVDKNVMVHKWAAIETTHVFPVKPLFSFIAVRWAVAVMTALLASAFYQFALGA